VHHCVLCFASSKVAARTSCLFWFDQFWFDQFWFDQFWFDQFWFDQFWFDQFWFDPFSVGIDWGCWEAGI
jgi:hypothetical protein